MKNWLLTRSRLGILIFGIGLGFAFASIIDHEHMVIVGILTMGASLFIVSLAGITRVSK